MLYRITFRIFRFLFRHLAMILLAACCLFFASHALRSSPRLSLYEHVFLQDIRDLAIPGKNVTLHELSIFVPSIWKDVSQAQSRHPALVSAYQARDLWGRQMTMIITLQENTSGWERAETGDTYFTAWYAGKGSRLYRIDVQASGTHAAASRKLCRTLKCMLSSIKITETDSPL